MPIDPQVQALLDAARELPPLHTLTPEQPRGPALCAQLLIYPVTRSAGTLRRTPRGMD